MEGSWQDYTIVAEMGRRVEIMLFGHYEARFLEDDDLSIDRYLLTFLTTEEERLAFRKRLPRMAEEVAQRPQFLDAVVSLAHELMKGMLVDGERAGILHPKRARARLMMADPRFRPSRNRSPGT